MAVLMILLSDGERELLCLKINACTHRQSAPIYFFPDFFFVNNLLPITVFLYL